MELICANGKSDSGRKFANAEIWVPFASPNLNSLPRSPFLDVTQRSPCVTSKKQLRGRLKRQGPTGLPKHVNGKLPDPLDALLFMGK